MESKSEPPHADDRPPILRSWGQVYAVVIGSLIALVVAFSALGWAYQ